MVSKLALTLAAAGGVKALALRGDTGCTFTMTTSGAVTYPVGQHSSGQTRAGADITPAQFTLNGSSLTDNQSRGCWWTPPSTVLQCDVNQTPDTGFEIGCGGTVSYNGQTTFYECDAGENNEVNIYLQLDGSAQYCHEITLIANGCYSGDCATSYSASTPPTTSSACESTVSTVYSTIERSVSAVKPSVSTVVSTVTETVTSCASTVSNCPAETVPGPTETVSAPTETVYAPTETVPGPTETVLGPTETVPGPTETVAGPTQTTTVQSPPETETVRTTLTETVSPAYPTSTPQPTTLSSVTSKPTQPSYSATPTTPSQSSSFPQPSEVNIPSSCPGNVSNAGEFTLPTLIIPIDSSSPDTAAGTSYFGEVSATKSSVFGFDIPASASGKTCDLVFLFPQQEDLETSSYTFSGSGALDFSRLSSAADQQTTYANAPGVAQDLGQLTVAPGNAYSVASFDCPAGEKVSFKLSDVEGGDTSLRFFQDYNPCPIGLFITTS